MVVELLECVVVPPFWVLCGCGGVGLVEVLVWCLWVVCVIEHCNDTLGVVIPLGVFTRIVVSCGLGDYELTTVATVTWTVEWGGTFDPVRWYCC